MDKENNIKEFEGVKKSSFILVIILLLVLVSVPLEFPYYILIILGFIFAFMIIYTGRDLLRLMRKHLVLMS